MKFVTIRAIGETVHTSIKNYYFGIVGVIFTMIFNIFYDPAMYKFWEIGTNDYCGGKLGRQQLIVVAFVGFFGLLSQEAMA